MDQHRKYGGLRPAQVGVACVLFSCLLCAEAADVKVKSSDGKWTLETPALSVVLDLERMSFDVSHKEAGIVWRMMTPGEHDVAVEVSGKTTWANFANAAVKQAEVCSEGDWVGVAVKLAGFKEIEHLRDATLTIRLLLNPKAAEVRCELVPPKKSQEYKIKECRYPRALAIPQQRDCYGVIPTRGGWLLPGDWDRAYNLSLEWGRGWGGLTMAWWGAVNGASAYVGIFETPFDAKLLISHPAGGPPTIGPEWNTSHGSMRYARRLLYSFHHKGDYVTLAKRYREHAVKVGLFKSLTEKCRDNPNVARLYGAVFIPTGIAWCDMREQPKVPPLRIDATFAERAEQIRKLREKGLVRGYIHLDGWGKRGYDNLHPDVLPPCEQAGGWEGLRKLSEAAAEAGYLFGLHDNYDDFFLDSPAWSEKLTIKGPDGQSPRADWVGGPMSFLCPVVAMPFLERTFREMDRHGVKLTAYYIDDLTAIRLRECYDPKHPLTREEFVQSTKKILRYVQARGIVMSSECGAEWGIPVLDHIYWLNPVRYGVPVPLFHLVYHDALVVPSSVRGNTDDERREQCLRAVLYGEMTMLSMDSCFNERLLKRAMLMAKVHRLTGPAEMVDHKFLSEDYQVQESVFSNGVRVWADFAKKQFKVTGADKFPAEIMPVRGEAFNIRLRVADFKYPGGREFEITYEWQVGEKLDHNYKCWAHLLSDQSNRPDRIAINADHALTPPPTQWKPGTVVRDGPHRVTIPDRFRPGKFELVAGLWLPGEGDLMISDWQGQGMRRVDLGKIIVEGADGGIDRIRFVSPQKD